MMFLVLELIVMASICGMLSVYQRQKVLSSYKTEAVASKQMGNALQGTIHLKMNILTSCFKPV